VHKIRTRCQRRVYPHILRAFDRFVKILSFQRNHRRAFPPQHWRLIPIDIPAPKNALHFIHRVRRLTKRFAAVNLLQFIRETPILSRPVHGFDSRTRCSLVKRSVWLGKLALFGSDEYPLSHLRNGHVCCIGLLQRVLGCSFFERLVVRATTLGRIVAMRFLSTRAMSRVAGSNPAPLALIRGCVWAL
jgi:hypothetical protein